MKDCFPGAFPGDKVPQIWELAEKTYISECFTEKIRIFLNIEFPDMERVGPADQVSVDSLVRRGHDQYSVRLQHAFDLR